jgi:DNA-binding transcriptional MerR regulator
MSKEWIDLIIKAKELGLTPDEVRKALAEMKEGEKCQKSTK